MSINQPCEQCSLEKPHIVAERTRLENRKPVRVTDHDIYNYHYALEASRWIDDCADMPQTEDGSCAVGTTCHGDWGPCTCGCNEQLAAGGDCWCVLCVSILTHPERAGASGFNVV